MEIAVDFAGDKKVTAKFKGFTVETDQSIRGGGGGTAPEPFGLFLASIAACSGYYVLDFCLTRDIPTKGIRLFMRTEWDKVKKLVGKISIEIQLPPSFPEKYEKAVERAVGACSVKKNIFDPPEFDIYSTKSTS
ncbi:MAG: OsmC family protein [Candidatus Latescibacterota bacterium]|nr:MAG: OsmC family protein [Candidatus Latescibacterota bacterium]